MRDTRTVWISFLSFCMASGSSGSRIGPPAGGATAGVDLAWKDGAHQSACKAKTTGNKFTVRIRCVGIRLCVHVIAEISGRASKQACMQRPPSAWSGPSAAAACSPVRVGKVGMNADFPGFSAPPSPVDCEGPASCVLLLLPGLRRTGSLGMALPPLMPATASPDDTAASLFDLCREVGEGGACLVGVVVAMPPLQAADHSKPADLLPRCETPMATSVHRLLPKCLQRPAMGGLQCDSMAPGVRDRAWMHPHSQRRRQCEVHGCHATRTTACDVCNVKGQPCEDALQRCQLTSTAAPLCRTAAPPLRRAQRWLCDRDWNKSVSASACASHQYSW